MKIRLESQTLSCSPFLLVSQITTSCGLTGSTLSDNDVSMCVVFDNITGMFWICIAARKNSQLSSLFQQPFYAPNWVCVLPHSWHSYSSRRNSTVITCVLGHSMDRILQLSYYKLLKNKLSLEATSLRTACWGCTLYSSMFVYATNLEPISRKLQKSQNTEFL